MSTEIDVAPSVAVASRLERAHAAERSLAVAVLKATLWAVPICVAVWVGLVALALALAHSGNFVVALPVAGGVGVVAGGFFGMWWGFLVKAHEFEELDREAGRPSP